MEISRHCAYQHYVTRTAHHASPVPSNVTRGASPRLVEVVAAKSREARGGSAPSTTRVDNAVVVSKENHVTEL